MLGCLGWYMGYFACRAAPMGRVTAPVVAAAFYSFPPHLVARAVPDAWQRATPERFLEARLGAVDAIFTRVLGDDRFDADLDRAATLAGEAAAAAVTAGRPLAAANAALPAPEPGHLALWQALTTLREHRGDGHVHALLSADIGPCASLLLAIAGGRIPDEVPQARRWSDADIGAAWASLLERGWIDGRHRLTERGTTAAAALEDTTDGLAAQPYEALGEDRVGELLRLLRHLAEHFHAAGLVPSPSPVGLTWPPPPIRH